VRERLSRKETRIDPTDYPQPRGAPGIFKVEPVNVENQVMVQRALAGELTKALRLKITNIADDLIRATIG